MNTENCTDRTQVNKSDRNDARGIAQMMRVGLFRPVHVFSHDHFCTRVSMTCAASEQRSHGLVAT